MHSTNYIIRFVVIMTSIVALALSGLFYATKDRADQNEAVFNKRAILSAVASHLDADLGALEDEDVILIFENSVEQVVLDMEGNAIADLKAEEIDMAKEKKKPESERNLPLYIYEKDGKKYYIVSVRGSGLWDEIWGCIAIENDFSTVVGASFDHAGETPGLGAEIKDNPSFKAQFAGKKLFGSQGEYNSIVVRKGGAKNKTYEVDGISGATVTCDGVTEMIKRGIAYYTPYFDKVKSKKNVNG